MPYFIFGKLWKNISSQKIFSRHHYLSSEIPHRLWGIASHVWLNHQGNSSKILIPRTQPKDPDSIIKGETKASLSLSSLGHFTDLGRLCISALGHSKESQYTGTSGLEKCKHNLILIRTQMCLRKCWKRTGLKARAEP